MEINLYKKFESVLGEENITQDPCTLDAYRYQWVMAEHGEIPDTAIRLLPHRAECVVLPSTTEEVQAVVKLCNRYGLKFKAHSTGWGAHAAPHQPGVVLMDLRRMNRLIEINEKDMYALVEPYVIWGQLQEMAFKKGLNCCTIGAGSCASPLASCTSGWGSAHFNVSMGYSQRNVLGVEWVLPNGEVLRLGSPGSGAGWISGDGPGPSLRGAMRGLVGGVGGFGVFTKCAVRLYHWGGPPSLPSKGFVVGEERLVDYPSNTKIIMPSFETVEDMHQAMSKIGESEIADAVVILGRGLLALAFAPDNSGSVDMLRDFLPMLPKYAFNLFLVGNTPDELEYKLAVTDKILEATRGEKLDILDQDEALRDAVLLAIVKVGNVAARTFSTAGSFNPLGSHMFSSFRNWVKMHKVVEKLKKEYCASGNILDDSGDGTWGPGVMDQGHNWYFENEVAFDHTVPESKKAMSGLTDEVVAWGVENNIPSWAAMPEDQQLDAVPRNVELHYSAKFRNALDPNETSDSAFFTGIYRPESQS